MENGTAIHYVAVNANGTAEVTVTVSCAKIVSQVRPGDSVVPRPLAQLLFGVASGFLVVSLSAWTTCCHAFLPGSVIVLVNTRRQLVTPHLVSIKPALSSAPLCMFHCKFKP